MTYTAVPKESRESKEGMSLLSFSFAPFCFCNVATHIKNLTLVPFCTCFHLPLFAFARGLTFLNEFSEGTLLHARSILPHETIHWQTACATDSKEKCPVGIPCPHSTTYKDSLLDKNKFIDQNTGNYCNCWPNRHIQEYWLPKLKYALAELNRDHVRDLTRK